MLTWCWVSPSLKGALPGAYELLTAEGFHWRVGGFVAYGMGGEGGPFKRRGLLPDLPGWVGGCLELIYWGKIAAVGLSYHPGLI